MKLEEIIEALQHIQNAHVLDVLALAVKRRKRELNKAAKAVQAKLAPRA